MMQIETFELKNKFKDKIEILNYGARIYKWSINTKENFREIILRYPQPNDYINDPFYLGAIVGPYANRIAHSRVYLNKKNIFLQPNERKNHLHGGNNSLSEMLWSCIEHNEDSLKLSCNFQDGFNGYPGKMRFEVFYKMTSKRDLDISINVTSEKTTIAGPSSHPYFNLNYDSLENKHFLKLNTKYFTPKNSVGIPNGEIISNDQNTLFNFSETTVIDNSINLDDNFLFTKEDTTLRDETSKIGSLVSHDKKIKLEVESNYPAIQVYTGQYLKEPFHPKQAVCLEPQFCPNSPNIKSFPYHNTKPELPLQTRIIYRISEI